MPKVETFKTQPARTFDGRANSTQRGYDRRWAKLRKWHLQRQPLCVHCEAKGITKAAQDVDHLQPFQGKHDRLRLDPNNLQSLCRACHNRKTRNGNA